MARKNLTLGDVIEAVAEFAESDAEIAATVTHMVHSGSIRFMGRLRGVRFELVDGPVTAVASVAARLAKAA